jgi:hypothetical protein
MRYADWLLPFPLLFLISVSSSSSQQRDSSLTLPVYEDADAYEVYSATLPMDSSYQDSKAVLILQSVPPSEWPIGSPREALHGDSAFNETFAPIFDSFDKANQESRSLEHRFSIPKPYKLLSKNEIDVAFRHRAPNALDDGWGGFREAFPESRGYIILSGVGFNADRTLALVYFEHRCGGLCAAERYYILEERKGHWGQYKPKGKVLEMRGMS